MLKNKCVILTVSCSLFLFGRHCATGDVWLTDPAGSERFVRLEPGLTFSKKTDVGMPTIDVDPAKTFQTVDGFGYTLTGGSASLIRAMTDQARAALLSDLFGREGSGIGVSVLRISIGASDLDDQPFSYDDLPAGRADPGLKSFQIDRDRVALIPVLKQILQVEPRLKIMASPWSPPVWMKTNGKTVGGRLRSEYAGVYAVYLVKYVQAMKAEDIKIDAITVQNEPLNPSNNPSLLMDATEQTDFVKNHLGPAFKAAEIDIKIIIYDHNCDRPDYPIAVLNDPVARKFVDGSAFHLYAGKIGAMSAVHEAHPDKNLYFTEQWTGAPGNLQGDLAWHTRELTIGAPRNWSRVVLEWNLAADRNQKPHTPGGCTQCLGAITIDGDRVTRNPAYYVIAHASKFVRPGSVRVASTELPGLPNVAFKTADGSFVLIVLNDGKTPRGFAVRSGKVHAIAKLHAGAVATILWR